MRKTTIAKLLVFALLVAMLPMSAFAVDWGNLSNGGSDYSISGDTVTVLNATSIDDIGTIYNLTYDTVYFKPGASLADGGAYKVDLDGDTIDHVIVGILTGEVSLGATYSNNGAVAVPDFATPSGSPSNVYVITLDAGGAYFYNLGDATTVAVYVDNADTNVSQLLSSRALAVTGGGSWVGWFDDLGNNWSSNGYVISQDTALTARWGESESESGGSTESGAGGGGGAAAGGGSEEVAVTTTTSGDTVTVATTTRAVEAAIAAADSDEPVVIDLSDANSNVTTATIPTEVLETIENSDGCDGVTIQMPAGDVTLDDEALAEILEDASGASISITLDVDTVDNALDAEQKETVEGLVTGDVITATVKSGDVVIDDFGVGRVTITVPFTPPANRPGAKFFVYHVPETGALERHQTSFADGKISFVTTHFSDFVTIFEPFADSVATDWYAQYLTYVYDNELMNGMGNDKFEPATNMSRAMMAQVLFNLSKGTDTKDAGFTDVEAGKWFADAINWAKNSGVTSGSNTEGTIYEPYVQMTREQMVRFMYNYAKTMGKDVSATTSLESYPDAADVSNWAVEAMQWAVATGMITNMDGKLQPQTITTRAMLATVMTRFAQAMA